MSDVRLVVELVEILSAIARWYPGTADPPHVAESGTQLAYGSRLPTGTDVLSLRRRTVDTLTSWALVIAEERDLHPTVPCAKPIEHVVYGPEPRQGWPPPTCGCWRARGRVLLPGRRHRLGQDVGDLTTFLAVHAEWLADQDGGQAIDDLGGLAQQLEQVVRQTRPARVRIGPCPEPGCTGTLIATVRKADDVLPSAVRCNLAPRDHVWEPHDWPSLGRRIPLRPEGMARLLQAIADVPRPRTWGIAPTAPEPVQEFTPDVLRGVAPHLDAPGDKDTA